MERGIARRQTASVYLKQLVGIGVLLHEPSFQHLLPEAVFQKARVIQKVGNQAVHNPRPIYQIDAHQVVTELDHLMEHGHEVEGGDRLAETIIFARNHEPAKFIDERFNHHYPHDAGQFALVIAVLGAVLDVINTWHGLERLELVTRLGIDDAAADRVNVYAPLGKAERRHWQTQAGLNNRRAFLIP